jgi:hypothetical protein
MDKFISSVKTSQIRVYGAMLFCHSEVIEYEIFALFVLPVQSLGRFGIQGASFAARAKSVKYGPFLNVGLQIN